MASTSTVRRWWKQWWKCAPARFPFMGRVATRFPSEVHAAVAAAEAALRGQGYGDASNVGSYYPRPIKSKKCIAVCNMTLGGYCCSMHGYGLAFDLDPAENPYYHRPIDAGLWRRIRLTEAQVRAVEAIRTRSGKQVWRWLGWSIGDTMHFQVDCSPKDLSTGIDPSTVDGDVTVPKEEPMLSQGDKGSAVKAMQDALLRYDSSLLPKWGADADFGGETVAALKEFQSDHDVVPSGVLDSATVFCLAPYQGLGEGGDTAAIVELDADLTALEIEVENVKSTLRSV